MDLRYDVIIMNIIKAFMNFEVFLIVINGGSGVSDNSTQMYYLVLTIDADVWEEVQESLISFSLDNPVRVDQLTATTSNLQTLSLFVCISRWEKRSDLY